MEDGGDDVSASTPASSFAAAADAPEGSNTSQIVNEMPGTPESDDDDGAVDFSVSSADSKAVAGMWRQQELEDATARRKAASSAAGGGGGLFPATIQAAEEHVKAAAERLRLAAAAARAKREQREAEEAAAKNTMGRRLRPVWLRMGIFFPASARIASVEEADAGTPQYVRTLETAFDAMWIPFVVVALTAAVSVWAYGERERRQATGNIEALRACDPDRVDLANRSHVYSGAGDIAWHPEVDASSGEWTRDCVIGAGQAQPQRPSPIAVAALLASGETEAMPPARPYSRELFDAAVASVEPSAMFYTHKDLWTGCVTAPSAPHKCVATIGTLHRTLLRASKERCLCGWQLARASPSGDCDAAEDNGTPPATGELYETIPQLASTVVLPESAGAHVATVLFNAFIEEGGGGEGTKQSVLVPYKARSGGESAVYDVRNYVSIPEVVVVRASAYTDQALVPWPTKRRGGNAVAARTQPAVAAAGTTDKESPPSDADALLSAAASAAEDIVVSVVNETVPPHVRRASRLAAAWGTRWFYRAVDAASGVVERVASASPPLFRLLGSGGDDADGGNDGDDEAETIPPAYQNVSVTLRREAAACAYFCLRGV